MSIRVEFKKSQTSVAYPEALEVMQRRTEAIVAGTKQAFLWFLEHPKLYTAGTGANESELLDKYKYPVYQTGRGGKYTYHGPGQRVAYVMLDIKQVHDGQPDLKRFVSQLEQWVIDTLAGFNIKGETREGRVGIWVVDHAGKENKIAAIGIRIKKWVSFHGVAINIRTDLDDYNGIVPCGISEHGITSLRELGVAASMDAFDEALKINFTRIFNVCLS